MWDDNHTFGKQIRRPKWTDEATLYHNGFESNDLICEELNFSKKILFEIGLKILSSETKKFM